VSFVSSVRGQVLYVTWRGFDADDLRGVAAAVLELRRATGKPVVFLSRVPASDHVFTDEERALMLDFFLAILPSCASVHHVLEGAGFLKSGRRAIVTNLALATPRPRDFFTHDSVAAAKAAIESSCGVDLDELGAKRPTTTASGAFRAATARLGRKG